MFICAILYLTSPTLCMTICHYRYKRKDIFVNIITEKYNILCNIKNSLGIKRQEEVSKSIILEMVKYRNLNEIYLMKYLVDNITNAPKRIYKQNTILIKKFNNPRILKQSLEQTNYLYETNNEFINYQKKISRELYLSKQINRNIVNCIIYEFAYNFINKNIQLSKTNIFLNFYLMQKWLTEQEKIQILPLDYIEENIILALLNGYQIDDLIDFFHTDKQKLKTYFKYLTENILLQKLQVETSNQAIIKYYYIKILKRNS